MKNPIQTSFVIFFVLCSYMHSADACGPGQENMTENGIESCQPCLDGTYNSGSSFDCVNCTDYMITGMTGATSKDQCVLQDCGLGQRNHKGVCTDCSPEEYSDTHDNATECKICDDYHTTNMTGAISEDQCLRRMCGPGLKSAKRKCVNCAVGRTSNVLDTKTKCTACHQSLWQPKSGQTECIPCGPNSWSKWTRKYQFGMCKCRPGHGAVASSIPNVRNCTKCPIGTFNHDRNGRLSCITCAEGLTTKQIGSNRPDHCVSDGTCGAGLENRNNDDTLNCQPCSKGSYSDGWSKNCTACAANMTTNGPGATHTDQCIELTRDLIESKIALIVQTTNEMLSLVNLI
jgi:hypothetical protein